MRTRAEGPEAAEKCSLGFIPIQRKAQADFFDCVRCHSHQSSPSADLPSGNPDSVPRRRLAQRRTSQSGKRLADDPHRRSGCFANLQIRTTMGMLLAGRRRTATQFCIDIEHQPDHGRGPGILGREHRQHSLSVWGNVERVEQARIRQRVSDQCRAFSTTKESPLTEYAATPIRWSRV